MSVPVSVASFASFSSFSDLVSMVLTICVEMLRGLSTSSAVYSSNSKEIIERLVIYSVESSSYCTTHQNSGKLVE